MAALLLPVVVSLLVQRAAGLASTPDADLLTHRELGRRSDAHEHSAAALADIGRLGSPPKGFGTVEGALLFVVPRPDKFVHDEVVLQVVQRALLKVAQLRLHENFEVDVKMATTENAGLALAKASFRATFADSQDSQIFANSFSGLGGVNAVIRNICWDRSTPSPYFARVRPVSIFGEKPALNITSFSNLTFQAPQPVRFVADKSVHDAIASSIAELGGVDRSQVGFVMAVDDRALVQLSFWVISKSTGFRKTFVASLGDDWQNDLIEKMRLRLPSSYKDVSLLPSAATARPPLFRFPLSLSSVEADAVQVPIDAIARTAVGVLVPGSVISVKAYSSVALIMPRSQSALSNSASPTMQKAMKEKLVQTFAAQASDLSLASDGQLLWVDFSVSFDQMSSRQKYTRSYAADGAQQLSRDLCALVKTHLRSTCGVPETSEDLSSTSVDWIY